MRISVLGPLDLRRGGVAVPLGTGMPRAVLGLLALYPNTGLHHDAIIEALWGSAPPATAINQVQAHISKLRRMLEPDRTSRRIGGLLELAGSSYVLRVTAEQLDLLAFHHLAGRAHAAHVHADPRAGELYEEALGLWRASPLAELDLLRSHPAVMALTGQWDTLIVEYAEVTFTVGQHVRVVPHLRALVQRDPLNEKAHAVLMLALAGAGQQAAALQVFNDLRCRLDEQLGVYPGAELAEAHARVLRQEIPGGSAYGTENAPSAATRAAKQRSDKQDAERQFVGLPASGRPPVCQLPPTLSDFAGRTADVASLITFLKPAPDSIVVPVAVISGQPGVGKTALALQVAHLVRHVFPDGQLYVELAGSTRLPRDPADVLSEMLRAFGLHGSVIPQATAERAALYRSQTAGQKILVMVDDAESVDQVRPLLPGTAGCAVIVTSRSRLGELAGAQLCHLEPLPHPDAVELLGRIVGHERVAAEAQASDKLVAACGRLPLAVRIAGAKLATRPSWPITRIADAVADERRRLDELTLGDLAFRASVMPSYEALDEPARRAFRRLGLLWPTDVAEWVINMLLDDPGGGDVVNQLTDKSLLMPVGTDATGEARYRLHDLLRDYAVEQFDPEQDREQHSALVRVLTGWLEIAAAADLRLPRVPAILRSASPDAGIIASQARDRLTADPIAWFTAERLNLIAAVRRACAAGLYKLAAQLAAHQATFQFLQARLDDAEQLWQLVISASKAAGDIAATAHAELQLVQFMAERGKNAEALAMLERCVRVFEELEDDEALAYALHWRAYCAEEQSQLQQARQDAGRSVDVARRVGDRNSELSSLRVLGVVITRLGEYDAGINACKGALAIARELKEPYAEFECLHALAYTNIEASRPAAAIDMCLRGHEISRDLGYTVGEAYMLGLQCDAYHALGRYQDAIAALSDAQQIFRSRGMRRGDALCSFKMALAYRALGHYEQAAEYLKTALPAFRALHIPVYEEQILRALDECEAVPPVT